MFVTIAGALRRGVLRKTKPDFVALRGPDHGIGDAGIAAGGIDQDFVRREQAGTLAFHDHVQSRAVFHAAAGVEILGLTVDFNARKRGGHLAEAQQGRVADISNDTVRHAGTHAGFVWMK